MNMRTVQHRTNNAYDSILLIEDGTVIGAWTTTRDDEPWTNYLAALSGTEDLADWETTHPDHAEPEDYGVLVEDHGKIANEHEMLLSVLVDLLQERYKHGGCPNSSPAWETARTVYNEIAGTDI